MSSILTVTINPALDVFLESPQLKPNGKLRCPKPVYIPGGGGINVSRAIRRLGGESTALFPAGGSVGTRVIELLRRESITTNVIRIADETRENVNVIEDGTRLEYRFIVPGPDVGMDEWNHVLRAIRSIRPRPDYLVASGSLPPGVPLDFYARLGRLCDELAIRMIVDTSGESLRRAGGKGTYMIKPNVGELMVIAGGGAISDTAIVAAAQSLIKTGRCEIVVVSAGGGGAIVADREGTRRFPAPVVAVGSRVGAGDSMVAGITVALAKGWTVDEAVMFGVAAGSAAVMTHRHELCRLEDTERLYGDIHASGHRPTERKISRDAAHMHV